MELFRIKRDIPFMRYGRLTTTISLLTFVWAVFFLATRSLNLGVDFTGGTIMEVGYSHPANLDAIRQAIDGIGLKEASVQNFGSSSEVLIRLPVKVKLSMSALSEQVKQTLSAQDNSAKVRRVESVGAQVGDELYENGSLALFFVCVGIMLYLWLRFEWRFAVAAIIANLHDVVIILGFFAFFQWEFNLTVLAAVLAVLGYSVNESVVVFDRVRENFRKMRKHSVVEVIDNAITRTMSRTVITHLLTQTMVGSMLLFGGEVLHNFALALTIGILFGIYSSVLVACPVAMWLGISRGNWPAPAENRTPMSPRQSKEFHQRPLQKSALARFFNRHATAGLLFYAVLISCAHSQENPPTLTIATAANMQPAFDDLAAAFYRQTGTPAQAVLGASGKLSVQIEQGAPFDVFLSADADYPQRLFVAGYTTGAPRRYALGTLVVCMPRTISNAPSLAGLTAAKVNKIAIADPALAPFGKQAWVALNFYQLGAIVQPKLVYGESVLQVNQYLKLGLVEAAITAKSINVTANIACADVPPNSYAPIEQSLVVLKHQPALAIQFADFMLGPEAQAILHRYGYR